MIGYTRREPTWDFWGGGELPPVTTWNIQPAAVVMVTQAVLLRGNYEGRISLPPKPGSGAVNSRLCSWKCIMYGYTWQF